MADGAATDRSTNKHKGEINNGPCKGRGTSRLDDNGDRAEKGEDCKSELHILKVQNQIVGSGRRLAGHLEQVGHDNGAVRNCDGRIKTCSHCRT